jgi:hypothetical protein
MKEITAALIALAEANVPVDIQEMLVRGNDSVAPGALEKAIAAVDRQRDLEKRMACKHPRRIGNGSLGSDGSYSMKWSCPDCFASGESSSIPRTMTKEEIDAAPGLIGR